MSDISNALRAISLFPEARMVSVVVVIVVICTCTLSLKKTPFVNDQYLREILTDFQNSFTGTFYKQFAIR